MSTMLLIRDDVNIVSCHVHCTCGPPRLSGLSLQVLKLPVIGSRRQPFSEQTVQTTSVWVVGLVDFTAGGNGWRWSLDGRCWGRPTSDCCWFLSFETSASMSTYTDRVVRLPNLHQSRNRINSVGYSEGVPIPSGQGSEEGAVFYFLWMQWLLVNTDARYWYSNSVRPPVCLSVCLSVTFRY